MFEGIFAGLKVVLAYEETERERREQEAHRQAEFALRREFAKKRKDREERRVAYLREVMQLRREAADIRSWLASVPGGAVVDSSTEVGRMLRWARERLTDLEAQTTVDAVGIQLEGKSLFPEVDELHDPRGNPQEPRSCW